MARKKDDEVLADGSPLADRIRSRLASLKDEPPPETPPAEADAPAPAAEPEPPGAAEAGAANPDAPAEPPASATHEIKERYAELVKSYRKVKDRLDSLRDIEAKCERLLHAHFNTIDDLNRALDVIQAQLPNDAAPDGTGQILRNMLTGVQQVRDRLFEVLTHENELECLEPQRGEPYDAQRHEAIETVRAADVEPNTIVEVIEPGYVLEGKVLRPARVKVAARTE